MSVVWPESAEFRAINKPGPAQQSLSMPRSQRRGTQLLIVDVAFVAVLVGLRILDDHTRGLPAYLTDFMWATGVAFVASHATLLGLSIALGNMPRGERRAWFLVGSLGLELLLDFITKNNQHLMFMPTIMVAGTTAFFGFAP